MQRLSRRFKAVVCPSDVPISYGRVVACAVGGASAVTGAVAAAWLARHRIDDVFTAVGDTIQNKIAEHDRWYREQERAAIAARVPTREEAALKTAPWVVRRNYQNAVEDVKAAKNAVAEKRLQIRMQTVRLAGNVVGGALLAVGLTGAARWSLVYAANDAARLDALRGVRDPCCRAWRFGMTRPLLYVPFVAVMATIGYMAGGELVQTIGDCMHKREAAAAAVGVLEKDVVAAELALKETQTRLLATQPVTYNIYMS